MTITECYGKCLSCGRIIELHEDPSPLMMCPNAFNYSDVIQSLMPTYSSSEERNAAVQMLEKGGYDIAVTGENAGVFFLEIPILAKLAEQLMRHEKVKGALFHEDCTVCEECVEKQRTCSSCGHVHDPSCPICDAGLVPYEE